MRYNLLTITVLALFAITPLAHAAPILIDFSDNVSGSITPDTSGRFWNQLGSVGTGVVLTNAVDQNNAATTFGLNVVGGAFVTEIGSTSIATLVDWDDAVTRDAWYVDSRSTSANPSATVRIEGLAANTAHDLSFFGSGNAQNFRGLGITINGTTLEDNFLDSDADGPDVAGESLLNFSNIVSNASGEIEFTVAAHSGGSYGYLNGMTINEVPEPASMVLLGLGGMVMLARRRRV